MHVLLNCFVNRCRLNDMCPKSKEPCILGYHGSVTGKAQRKGHLLPWLCVGLRPDAIAGCRSAAKHTVYCELAGGDKRNKPKPKPHPGVLALFLVCSPHLLADRFLCCRGELDRCGQQGEQQRVGRTGLRVLYLHRPRGACRRPAWDAQGHLEE